MGFVRLPAVRDGSARLAKPSSSASFQTGTAAELQDSRKTDWLRPTLTDLLKH